MSLYIFEIIGLYNEILSTFGINKNESRYLVDVNIF